MIVNNHKDDAVFYSESITCECDETVRIGESLVRTLGGLLSDRQWHDI